jgi:Carboxypeptidase regulatory-like domain
MANSVRLASVVLAAVLCAIRIADAQIIELRKVGDKTITCMHTGLMSDLNDCGVRSDWYAYVFVGSISSIKAAGNDDEEILEITPEELFYGNPSTPLTVFTSQGACLPTLAVGNRWLFYLRKENGKPIVLDYYGNDSRPVDSAQEKIETLRQLKGIGNLGIIRGSVERGQFGERRAVTGAQVVASRKSDNAQFFAATDANGGFEFAPLAPGTYKLTVDPIGLFRPDDSGVDVKSGSCWNVTMSRSPHARISGYLRHSDGSPAPGVPVLIIDADGSGFNTIESDADGRFSSDGMTPGKYLVAINSPDPPRWKISACGGVCEIPLGALYYPWMHDRSDALVIELSEDEKRNNIDFTIPKR